MAKAWAKAFYKSKAWQDCRSAYISSVHGLCERCLAKGEYVPGYIVHHKNHLTPTNISDPYVSLNADNLEYVCKHCHDLEHFIKEVDVVGEGLMFDSGGNLVRK